MKMKKVKRSRKSKEKSGSGDVGNPMKMRSLDYIIKYHPLKQNGVRYVPYCDYGWHQGIIEREMINKCETRGCKHYYKLMVEEDGT